MKNILNALKVGTEMDLGIFSELSFSKQKMMFDKMALIDEIEHGFITDEDKAKKCIQLIELMYEWDIDKSFECKHVLVFDDGTVVIQSTKDDYYMENEIDFIDGKLVLEDELEFESVNALMNYIECDIAMNV